MMLQSRHLFDFVYENVAEIDTDLHNISHC